MRVYNGARNPGRSRNVAALDHFYNACLERVLSSRFAVAIMQQGARVIRRLLKFVHQRGFACCGAVSISGRSSLCSCFSALFLRRRVLVVVRVFCFVLFCFFFSRRSYLFCSRCTHTLTHAVRDWARIIDRTPAPRRPLAVNT